MIPDAPISSFSMKLNGGKKGILVITDGNDNICSVAQKPFLAAQGHNGKRLDTATTMTVECPLAVASRTFTKSSVKVKVSGLERRPAHDQRPGDHDDPPHDHHGDDARR